MKWSSKALLLAVLASVAGTAWIVSGRGRPTAAQELAAVRALLAQEHFDEQSALRRLESCLRRARDAGDDQLAAEVRSTRGELFLLIGAEDAARADFEAVLAEHRPGDADIQLLLARTDVAAGDHERALVRLAALLEGSRDHASAWVASGLIHKELAGLRIEECQRELEFVLVAEEAQRAEELLTRIAACDPRDPARTTAALELRALVTPHEEERLALVLVLADEAGELHSRARRHFVESFAFGLDPDAVAGYLEILVDARQLGVALDFGALALTRPEVRDHQASAAVLIRALVERGDDRRAGALAHAWIDKDLPLEREFLLLMTRALYGAGRWPPLLQATHLLSRIGTPRDQEVASLYRGLAFTGMKQAQPALLGLRAFIDSEAPDPFPGATLRAWQATAQFAAERGDAFAEREALHEVLRLDPLAGGEQWLRLAELQLEARHSGFQVPLRSWAHGMCLSPERTEELLPRFRELGEQGLAAENRDIEIEFDDLRQQQRIQPRGEAGPYGLFRLAELNAEARYSHAVVILCRRLLEQFPGFLPALDLELDALLDLEKRTEAVELFVQRMEAVGRDERCEELAESLVGQEPTGEQLVRLVFADPDHAGRWAVAAHLDSRGERDSALLALEHGPAEERTPSETTMIAQLLAEGGQYDRALDVLADLDPESAAYRQTALARLAAGLHAGDDEVVEQAVESLLLDPEETKEVRLEAATLLLRLGDPEEALAVLHALDRDKVRDGRVLLLLTLASIAAGDLDGAEHECERSEAFLPPSAAGLARAWIALRRGDGYALERTVRRTLDAGEETEPLTRACVALLLDDPELALGLAAGALAVEPRSPVWTLIEATARLVGQGDPPALEAFGPGALAQTELFVNGSSLAPRDPREVPLVLLARAVPEFAPFLAGWLHGLEPQAGGELWPALLGSEFLVALDATAEARQVLERALELFPGCEPAWRARLDVERRIVGSASHPALAALRARLLRALGAARPETPEGLLLRAERARQEDRVEAAETLARRALELRADWPEGAAKLATVLAERGAYEEALQAWRRACLDPPPAACTPWVPGFVGTLQLAEDAGALSVPAAIEELERLAAHLPDDPRVALARAERELRADPQNPSIGVARAYALLETFLAEHGAQPLDRLQPGSAALWARFYLRLDPAEARTFLESERAREPGNLELWLLLARVQREEGDLDGAMALLNRIVRMAPDSRVQREIAATLASAGTAPGGIRVRLERAREMAGGAKLGLRAELLASESLLRQPQPSAWELAAAELEPMWEERRGAGPEERRVLGELYAQALLLRDFPGDRATARGALEESAPHERDPYRASLVEALRGLTYGEALRRPPEPEPVSALGTQ